MTTKFCYNCNKKFTVDEDTLICKKCKEYFCHTCSGETEFCKECEEENNIEAWNDAEQMAKDYKTMLEEFIDWYNGKYNKNVTVEKLRKKYLD